MYLALRLILLALLLCAPASAGNVQGAPPPTLQGRTESLRLSGERDYNNDVIWDAQDMTVSLLNTTNKAWTVLQVDCTVGTMSVGSALSELVMTVKRSDDGLATTETIVTETPATATENVNYVGVPNCAGEPGGDCKITNGEHLILTVKSTRTGAADTGPAYLVCSTKYVVDP